MFPILLKRIEYLAAILIISIRCSYAQTPQSQQSTSLRAFFQALIPQDAKKMLPSFVEAMKVIDQIDGMPAEDVANALPAIIDAWEYKDDNVKDYAGTALFAIGGRPDGTGLLRPYAKAIAGGLDLPNGRLQGGTVMLLALLRPEPQSKTVPLLVAFVKRTDRSPIAQASAFSLLLRIAPENPNLTPALRDFMARPMDEQTKDAVINGIANSDTENVVATDFLIGMLEDTSEQVRFQAVQGIERMPKDVIMRARPALQKVLERPDESQEVKDAAKEALRSAGR